MRFPILRPVLFVTAFASLISHSHAEILIKNQSGFVAPSFRGSANTTWFGWGSGSFDAEIGDPTNNNERIINPPATFGTTTSGYGLTQPAPYTGSDILASTNNIYTGVAQNSQTAALTLLVPTTGVLDTGFTTIIIQGVTNTAGSFASAQQLIQNKPVFGDIVIDSITYSPSFYIDVNSGNTGQWWVKYEIAGNKADYTFLINLPGGLATDGFTPISISGISVDTSWSASSFSSDLVVPEPSTCVLLGLGLAGVLFRRRR